MMLAAVETVTKTDPVGKDSAKNIRNFYLMIGFFLQNLGEKSMPYARRFASDSSVSVAERGRFALKSAGRDGL